MTDKIVHYWFVHACYKTIISQGSQGLRTLLNYRYVVFVITNKESVPGNRAIELAMIMYRYEDRNDCFPNANSQTFCLYN